MKYLFFILILSGCSTTVNELKIDYSDSDNLTLDGLLRAAYHSGCAERGLDDVSTPLDKHDNEVRNELNRCEDRSKTWHPTNIGIYSPKIKLRGER